MVCSQDRLPKCIWINEHKVKIVELFDKTPAFFTLSVPAYVVALESPISFPYIEPATLNSERFNKASAIVHI